MTAQLAQSGDDSPVSILCIDDEPRVLKSMRAMFRKDYDVHLANSGQDALDIIAEQNIRVVVSDQRMPEMTGVEVLTEIKQRSPATIRILLTGYADLAAVEASINDAEVYKYLMKPCPADEVRGAVAQGLQEQGVQDAPPQQQLAEVVQLEEVRPPEYRRTPRQEQPATNEVQVAAAPAADKKPDKPQSSRVRNETGQENVGVLVLGDDSAVVEAIVAAGDTKRSKKIQHAVHVEEAVELLSAQTIGVLVADIGAEEQQITQLVGAVHEVQPHLVIILVSDRSDANLLIQLINSGQIFRFLLKPLQAGQCKISLASARQRYADKVVEIPLLQAATETEIGRWRKFKNWLLGF